MEPNHTKNLHTGVRISNLITSLTHKKRLKESLKVKMSLFEGQYN